jgi:hypothetical protein
MARSSRPALAATANQQSSRTSNQRLSKITRRTQIVGSGRVPPGRNGLRWRDLCFEARDWAAFEARGSSGEGFSRSAVTDAAHNTSFTRRGLRPLATAGGVVGLHERRWKPLRRPCGRLSGLRKTLNVSGNARNDKQMCGQRQPPRCGGASAGLALTRMVRFEVISLVESAHIR